MKCWPSKFQEISSYWKNIIAYIQQNLSRKEQSLYNIKLQVSGSWTQAPVHDSPYCTSVVAFWVMAMAWAHQCVAWAHFREWQWPKTTLFICCGSGHSVWGELIVPCHLSKGPENCPWPMEFTSINVVAFRCFVPRAAVV